MSAELDDGPERSFASRLRRRRVREDADDRVPADVGFDFGYGWTVTVAPIAGSDLLRAADMDAAEPRLLPGQRDDDPVRHDPPEPVDGRLMPRRPDSRRRAAPAQPEPAPPPPPPVIEDRPIIAPTPPRRRTMPEATSRLDGPRLGPRDRAEGDGARHRRAQRIIGGGTVMIDDALYPLIDWSTGGIAIRSEGHLYRIGDRRLLELEIDLDDYAVNLDLDGEVVNRTSDRTGWRFVNPTDTQRQVLRALTQATTGGTAAAFPRDRGGGRPAAAIAGAPRPRPRGRRRGRPNLVAALAAFPFNAVVILAVAGAIILAVNEGELPEVDLAGPAGSVPTATSTPAPAAAPAGPITAEHAAVAVERVALTAPLGGIVLEWAMAPGGSIARGEPLVSLAVGEADAARSEAVLSPCDCILARVLAVAGESVAEGGDLALLYESGVEAHVQALFAPSSAPYPGDPVTVTLTYTGEVRDGVVDRVGRRDEPGDFIGLPQSVFADNPADVFAVVRTDPGLPPALAGDPAEVTVRPRT